MVLRFGLPTKLVCLLTCCVGCRRQFCLILPNVGCRRDSGTGVLEPLCRVTMVPPNRPLPSKAPTFLHKFDMNRTNCTDTEKLLHSWRDSKRGIPIFSIYRQVRHGHADILKWLNEAKLLHSPPIATPQRIQIDPQCADTTGAHQ